MHENNQRNSAVHGAQNEHAQTNESPRKGKPVSDLPFIADVRNAARCNNAYRTVFWTGQHLQAALMCIPPRGEVGLEVHKDADQILFVEQGNGMAYMGSCKDRLNVCRPVCAGTAVFVPCGTWHNVCNTGSCSMKLVSMYAPPQHPRGAVECCPSD